jgi:hypothetical protein
LQFLVRDLRIGSKRFALRESARIFHGVLGKERVAVNGTAGLCRGARGRRAEVVNRIRRRN